MIAKIKELINIKQDIDGIKTTLDNNTLSMKSFSEEFRGVRTELIEVRKKQNEFLDNFKENLDLIKHIKNDLKEEVYHFKLLKSQLQNKLIEKFENELKSELKCNISSLKNDLKEYEDLRNKISEILDKTKNASNEIEKFVEISKSIKKEDYELKTYANELLKMDKEKLDLMRKIDSLERLISKIRRQK
ncbi:MAG: hypothetical protein ABIC04_00255 [Nanoarchaeota archaeon]